MDANLQRRAEAARAILNNAACADLLERLRTEALEAIAVTAPEDAAGRERAYYQVRALGDLRQRLQSIIVEAEAEVETLD